MNDVDAQIAHASAVADLIDAGHPDHLAEQVATAMVAAASTADDGRLFDGEWREQYAAGYLAERANQIARAKSLAAAFPDRPSFVMEAFINGWTIAQAKASLVDTLLAESAAANAKLAKFRQRIASNLSHECEPVALGDRFDDALEIIPADSDE